MNTARLQSRNAVDRGLLGLFALAAFAVHVFSSDDFDFKVLARTGPSGLTGIKSAPSINDLGQVAFVGVTASGESLVTVHQNVVTDVTPGFPHTLSTYFQLNNAGWLIARDSGAGLFRIRLWDTARPGWQTVLDDTSGIVKCYCSGGINAGKVCNCGPYDCPGWIFAGLPFIFWPCVTPPQSQYASLLFPSVNNHLQAAYLGAKPGGTDWYLVSKGPLGYFELLLPRSESNFRPWISDTGTILGRGGNNPASPIRLFNPDLKSAQANVAGPDDGFTQLGQNPGINDAGGIAAFFGVRADGPGIFAYLTDVGERFPIARAVTTNLLDPGIIGGFSVDDRISVNNHGAVVFLGYNREGQQALFLTTAELQTATNSFPQVLEVMAVGDTVTNLSGTVTGLAVWDALTNEKDSPEIAFRVTMSSGISAILTATEKPCKPCQSLSGCLDGSCILKCNSVDVTIGLGAAIGGRRAGSLTIQAKTPSGALSTPAALRVPSVSGFLRVFDAGVLRQIRSATSLADISADDAYRYHVRFYHEFSGPDPSSRLYTPSGAPFTTITIENPDRDGAFTRLRVIRNGTELGLYAFDDLTRSWQLTSDFGNAARTEMVEETVVDDRRTETREVRRGATDGRRLAAETALSRSVSTYQSFPWGEELIETREGPEPAKVTRYSYYTDSVAHGANYAQLRSVIYPDGRWEFYREYSPLHGLLKSTSQFLNHPYQESEQWPDPENRSTEVVRTGHVETHTEYLRGKPVARRWHAEMALDETLDAVATSPDAENYLSTSNLVTRTFTFLTSDAQGAKAGQTSRVMHPDGSVTLYAYYKELVDDWFQPGAAPPPQIEVHRTLIWSGAPNAGFTDILSGTVSEDATDLAGNLLWRREWAIPGDLLVSSEVVTARDPYGRPTRIEYLDGTYITRAYGCCGLESQTDREGVTTTYNTDHVVSLDLDGTGTPQTYYGTTVTRAGISTHILTDPLGRAFKTILQGSDSRLVVQDERHYNALGELDWSKDAMGRTTTYSESTENGFTFRTTTFPDGSQSTESTYQDGSAYETKGDAVQGLRYAYDVRQDNGVWVQTTTQTRLEADGSLSPEYTTTYTDFAGRAYKTEYPWPDGNTNVFAIREYNAQGQLAKSTDADGLTTLYAYNRARPRSPCFRMGDDRRGRRVSLV